MSNTIPKFFSTWNPTLSGIVGAIVGAIATGIVSLIVAKLAPPPSPPSIIIITPDGNQVKIPSSSLSLDKTLSSEGLTYSLKLTPQKLIALAPTTEFPLEGGTVPGLENQKITYADKKEQTPIVKDFLNNPYSGYQELVKGLKKLLDNRQGTGNYVPLMIIQGKYLNGDTSKPPLVYEQEKLKEAYVKAWKEKNSGSPLTEFDQIAPLQK